jgi:hypothetical protein
MVQKDLEMPCVNTKYLYQLVLGRLMIAPAPFDKGDERGKNAKLYSYILTKGAGQNSAYRPAFILCKIQPFIYRQSECLGKTSNANPPKKDAEKKFF